MDYYERRDDLDEPPLQVTEPSPVQKFYEGKHIFLTGGSGFMGKILMEKLLRTCNVGQISVLVREKKGVKVQERVVSLFADLVFDVLKLQKPGELRKVRIVTGDLSLPDMGLSEVDRLSLSTVNIIFHSAATLQMDQHLKVAYYTNVHSTKLLLELAKTLPNLQAFMYVSTAYTHAYLSKVEETSYDAVYNEEEISLLCKQLTEEQLGALTPKLVGRWGNTYALTKAWAENLVTKYEGILPVGIVRPSIVVSTWKEPLTGWINNVYGAVGVVTGTALGLLRLWAADPDMVGDMIPVDVAINMTLVATVEVAQKSSRQLKIYNLVSSTTNPITYDFLRTGGFSIGDDETLDSRKAIAYRSFFLVKSKTLFRLYSIWYHALPAILTDLFLQMTGKQPQLLKVYIKAFNVNRSLMPYCLEKHITFRSDNIDRLWNRLDPLDQKLFYYDLRPMKWSCFWLTGFKGLRVYLLKDPMDTVPEGIKHKRRLFLRKLLFDSIVYGTLSLLLYLFFKHLLLSHL